MHLFPVPVNPVADFVNAISNATNDIQNVIIPVLALGIAVTFIMQWFRKSTYWGGTLGSTVSNYRHRNDW
jgi:hypothetical protein